MNKSLLKQALKFKNETPTNNQIKTLINEALKYQKENELYFINIKHGQKPQVIDETNFLKFLSDINDLTINSFDDIEFYLDEVSNRKESIKKTGNSKEYYAKVFDKVVVYTKRRHSYLGFISPNEFEKRYNENVNKI